MNIGRESGREGPAADRVPGRGQQEGGVNRRMRPRGNQETQAGDIEG